MHPQHVLLVESNSLPLFRVIRSVPLQRRIWSEELSEDFCPPGKISPLTNFCAQLSVDYICGHGTTQDMISCSINKLLTNPAYNILCLVSFGVQSQTPKYADKLVTIYYECLLPILKNSGEATISWNRHMQNTNRIMQNVQHVKSESDVKTNNGEY